MGEAAEIHRVVHTMGTVFSITVRGGDVGPGALDEAEAWLRHVDAVFSTYREDSAVSRIARGELAPEDCAPEVRQVLRLCERAEAHTGGWFTTGYAGGFDPSGLVKGWAVERAAEGLLAAGATGVCVNGGGDVQLHGGPWRVGVAHPLRPGRVAAVVESRQGAVAVATSGPAERGCHIVDPHTRRAPVGGLASLTVVHEGLTDADTWATAAYAMGPEARAWLEAQPGVTAFAVTADGETWSVSP